MPPTDPFVLLKVSGVDCEFCQTEAQQLQTQPPAFSQLGERKLPLDSAGSSAKPGVTLIYLYISIYKVCVYIYICTLWTDGLKQRRRLLRKHYSAASLLGLSTPETFGDATNGGNSSNFCLRQMGNLRISPRHLSSPFSLIFSCKVGIREGSDRLLRTVNMISQLYEEPKLSPAATDSLPISVYSNNKKMLVAVFWGNAVSFHGLFPYHLQNVVQCFILPISLSRQFLMAKNQFHSPSFNLVVSLILPRE